MKRKLKRKGGDGKPLFSTPSKIFGEDAALLSSLLTVYTKIWNNNI